MLRPFNALNPLALAVLLACAVPAAQAAPSAHFEIAAGDLGQALNRFAEQAGLALAFDPALVSGRHTAGLSGDYNSSEAIARLLAGSGLQAVPIAAGRYRVEAAPEQGNGTVQLQSTNITSSYASDSVNEPIVGYVATRSLSATKTDTPLIETPQSISVVTKDQMRAQDAQSLNQVLRYTAAVIPETRGATASRLDQFTVRGFSPSLYLDGMRLASSRDAAPQLDAFDLDRVEVLRGPASVLYGQGTPSGVVNMVSKRPTSEPFHEVGVQYGTFNKKRTTFDLSGPLDDQGVYAYRVSGLYDSADGQVEHTETERRALAAAFTWRPSEATSLTLLGRFQKDPKGASYGSLPSQGVVQNNPLGHIDIDRYDGDKAFEKSDRENYSIGYLFEHKINDQLTFRQNARYLRSEGLYRSLYSNGFAKDSSGNIIDYRTLSRSTIATDVNIDAYNLDNQLQAKFDTGPIKHTVLFGADYLYTSTDTLSGSGVGPTLDVFNPVYGVPVTTPAYSADATARAQQKGLYLQEQMKWDRLVLLLGGRYDWANNHNTSERLATGVKTKTAYDSEAFTGRAGLVYLFDNGLAPYISYAESFEPQSGTAYGNKPFMPTEGKQYELGIKYQPPGGDSFITAAVFDLRKQNVTTLDPDPTHLCNGSRCSVQAGEVRSRGFELEGKAALTRNLDIVAAYAYLDNRYSKSNVASGAASKGATPWGVPRHTASVWADYTFREGPLKGFGMGAGTRYVSSSNDDANTFKVPGYTLVDAAVHYDIPHVYTPADNLRLAINATNLGDKKYVTSCYSSDWCWYGSQRTVQASATYQW
ncbi:TonB-dependent siderophore receptor [Pseudomonas sp. NPDC007930]|uniref:TonB-dependent siderophore receptor n=1 Tax=Pseudomonas sp. NPDC007930 TaxID=3364417 RepID=UPI0036DFE3A9